VTRPLRHAPFRTGTALARYARLEAVGLWREAPGAPQREVIASFGTATLVLRDHRDGTLGHWALAGIRALATDASGRVVYAMAPDGHETLAIGDREMIEAIDAVTATVHEAGSETALRRNRRWLVGLALVAALAALGATGTRVAEDVVAKLLPENAAARLGEEILLHLIETGGQPCTDPAGTAALARLAGTVGASVRVMDLNGPLVALPGGRILIDRNIFAAAESPAEVAGWVHLAADHGPSLRDLLGAAGALASLRLVASGGFDEAALGRAAASAVVPPPDPEAMPALAERLAAAGIDPAALAGGLGREGHGAAAVRFGEAAEGLAPVEPAEMPSREEWAALVAACG
jgi:hypothetical protein